MSETSSPLPKGHKGFQPHAVCCPTCNKRMEPRLGRHGAFYRCQTPGCQITIRAHRSGKPLGIPAPPLTRFWRLAAHKAFDPLWESGYVSRDCAYAILAQVLTLPREGAHIGNLSADQCKKLIKYLQDSGLSPLDPSSLPPHGT